MTTNDNALEGITVWYYHCKGCGKVGCLTIVKRQHLSEKQYEMVVEEESITKPHVCLFRLKDKEPVWDLITENKFHAQLIKPVSEEPEENKDRFADLDIGTD